MNDRVFSHFHVEPESPQWLDWRWQFQNRITDAETLSAIIDLSKEEKEEISRCLGGFRMAITPYFASLMDSSDPACPIRMQVVPSLLETRVLPWEKRDPLEEDKHSPATNIVHRYPDRVLFIATCQCATYCRYCIRKRYVGEEDYVISEAEKESAVRYIAESPQIRDVLVSGGDPLTMSDACLEDILSRLRAIKHVEIIRIGTRAPITLPMRITPELLEMLRKYHPLWMNIHFNHPKELTPESAKACGDIADAGIPLGNQSVLLKNINDDPGTMKTLLLALVRARVRPYYIYQCDLCDGTGHFRTKVEDGIRIMEHITGHISGFAVPKFVIDAPGGGGKILVSPASVVSIDDERVVMRNYTGKLYTYPQHPES